MSERRDLEEWDERRGRWVRLALHLPAGPVGGGGVPLILFSAGFGGGRGGYDLLARAWARRGLATAVVEHAGSGPEALARLADVPRRERSRALAERVSDPAERADRPLDLAFALDRLSALPGLDMARVGVAGHSFGAFTALAAGGIPVWDPAAGLRDLGDPRVRAVLALSPPSPGSFFRSEDLGRLALPLMLLTGTLDHGPFLEGPREDRAALFPLYGSRQKLLAVLEGADHMSFAEKGLRYKPFLGPVQELTGGFWGWALQGGPAPVPAGPLARWEATGLT